MFDIFVETSPLLPKNDDGFHMGIIHRSPSCPSITAVVFSTFDEPEQDHLSIKIGSGRWLNVKKDVRCPDCYPDCYETEDEQDDASTT